LGAKGSGKQKKQENYGGVWLAGILISKFKFFFFFAKPDFNIVSEMFGSPDSDPDIQNRVPKKHDLHF